MSITRARPLVSVVMPAYNAEPTLPESMASVLGQTCADVELLVIDDRSVDGTWHCIERAAACDARIVALRMPRNGGVSAARNLGIDAARGQFMAFLDSDDRWHPRKLEIQLASMKRQGARLSYTGYRRVSEDRRLLSIVDPPSEVGYADMLKSNRIGNLTGLYDRALGDPRFRRIGHEDYVFWLELVRRAGRAVRADEGGPLADYLVRKRSLSSDKYKAARWQWQIYRDIERLGLASSAWYFAHYAGNALTKRR